MVDFLHPLNFFFYIPLLGLSIASVAIILERLHDAVKNPLLHPRESKQLLQALRQRDLGPMAELLRGGNQLEVQYIREYLHLRKMGHPHIPIQMELLAREHILNREARLEGLSSIASIATMIGLLGTVTGMIWSFQTMSTAGRADPAIISGGIAQALITTAVGLGVALPSLAFFHFLRLRTRNLATRLEFLLEEIAAIHPAQAVPSTTPRMPSSGPTSSAGPMPPPGQLSPGR